MPDTAARPARRTLKGRVSLFAVAVIAVWIVLLTVAFNIVLADRLQRQNTDTLRARADSAAATVHVAASGTVSAAESATDAALDSGIWIYQGPVAVERPTGAAGLQSAADAIAARGVQVTEYDGQQRLLALPVYQGGRQVGTVVAAVSLLPNQHILQVALWGSGLLVLLLLAVAYPVVRMATGLALRPIDHMITQAADWSAHDIRHRFGRGQQFLELQTLAAHLDEVLDHLSAVVRHERQLPAELSHELRTPLARITAETDLLRVRPRSPRETEQAHAAIDAAATAMQGILDALLSTAHLEATDAPGRCPIEPVLAELTRGHANRITVRVSPKDLTAGVDEIVLRRIVAPIIDNAVRYTVHTVLISATRDDRGVVIDIQDDGPGVPAGWHARIFEPGFRGNPADGHDGAGLGLSLARRLARAADGDVVVETVAGATRFRVLLPPG